jgi:polyhydroxybutyrate depolymerase
MSASLMVDGKRRSYELHLPPAFESKGPLPLLIALHPFTSNGEGMEELTGFSRIADEESFIVAYPNGRQRVWNANPADPSSIIGPPADDVAFISALIDELVNEYAADAKRVYIVGASSGGLMTHRVACELTDKLAAAASAMISLPIDWNKYCRPSGALPFLIIQGVDDPFFPWEGGTVNEGPFRSSEYQSVADTTAFWVENNGAFVPPEVEEFPDTAPGDGTTVFREHYAAGASGAEVVLYGIRGGGHTWPGSKETLLRFLVGKTSKEIDASRIMWDFLRSHSRD